ncbi:MAG TPA: M50 family metallopeptidase [Dehalococcoidia bacterium]|nr:M50 family metallopeptidase [Dehalococcoidia bacterium]
MARFFRTTDWPYLGLIVLFFAVVNVFWATPFVYPLTILTTIFHELSHALATAFTGGTARDIIINADGSGVAFRQGGIDLIVAPAGYLGSTLFGAILLLTARWRRAGRCGRSRWCCSR